MRERACGTSPPILQRPEGPTHCARPLAASRHSDLSPADVSIRCRVTREQTDELFVVPPSGGLETRSTARKPPKGGTTNGLTTHLCVGSGAIQVPVLRTSTRFFWVPLTPPSRTGLLPDGFTTLWPVSRPCHWALPRCGRSPDRATGLDRRSPGSYVPGYRLSLVCSLITGRILTGHSEIPSDCRSGRRRKRP